MNKSLRGFTLVEIAVVLVVLGVLTTVITVGFNRTLTDSRDTVRSSRAGIIATALERYYEINGEYPSCSSLTQTGTVVTDSVLKGLDPATLLTPKSTAAATAATNSISCSDLTSASGPDSFAYIGDGTTSCTTGAACYEWTLKYIEEGSSQVKTIKSQRSTTLLAETAGAPTLTVSAAGLTQINASWSETSNATGYQLQSATNATFTANVVNTSVSGLSTSLSTLTPNTTYYFRVRPTVVASQGAWSDTKTVATWGLVAPVISSVANSSTTFTSSWAAVPYATSYNAQCSTDNVTWGSVGCAGTTAATSYNWTVAGAGTRLYFRTQAVNGAFTSSWSNVTNTTSPIAAPTAAPGMTAVMSGTNAVGTTGTAATCSQGTLMYSSQYQINAAAWTAWTAWSTTRPITTLAASEGFRYSFAARALCRGVSIDSAISTTSTASVVRPIAQPSAPNYLGPASFTHGVNDDPDYSGNCPAGTSVTNGTFRDQFVGGTAYGPHPWGYVGVPWLYAGQVDYWGKYQCQTAYAISPISPESYNRLPVY